MKKKVVSKEIYEKLTENLQGMENKVSATIKETYSFKGRKSPRIIASVMQVLTSPGDLIYDPFLGSGMTILAAKEAGVTLIGNELDNYTYNINKVLFEEINESELEKSFNIIKENAKDNVMSLYETKCCGVKNYIKKVLFDPKEGKQGFFNPSPNREILDGKNIKLVESCSICGKKSKMFDEGDWSKISEVSRIDATEFPNDEYLVNSRINITASTGANYYGAIFSHRNKVALLKIQKEISSLSSSAEKDFLQHVLVASLSLARVAMYSSSTDIMYHVVLEKAQEMNVWELFQTKYIKFMKFKKQFSTVQTDCFESNDNYSIYNTDYLSFLKENPKLLFDGIFTDFPYTDQVPYLERNQLFRVWLMHFAENKEKYHLTEEMLEAEIVVTNAETRRNKNLDCFYNDIDIMFEFFSNHLPEGRPVVIFTKLGKKKYFNVFARIVDCARRNGFEYVFRVGVEKNDPTLRKQSAYKNTLINEVIIVFEKLRNDERYLYLGHENFEKKIIDDIYRLVKKAKDDPFTMGAAVLAVKKEVIKKGYDYNDELERKIIRIIHENFHVDNEQYIQLSKKQLYLEQEDEATLFKKLYELVPYYIRKLLNEKGKFVLEDLYVELIDELSDGNNQILYELLNNSDNIREIDSLIDDKTSREGKYYIKKELPKNFNESAIDVATMDPYEFEDLCKKLLEYEKYSDAHRKGGSGDLGVDIVAKKFTGNESEWWLFQCKRWVSKVDATPIQRLVSERLRLGADRVACFTTSGYTKDAIKIANEQNVELYDGEALMIRLERHFPKQYYNSNIVNK